jgi:deferrochelatase/peroxidase EfeB
MYSHLGVTGASLATNPDSDPGVDVGKDPQQNDHFDTYGRDDKKCPFAAHTRKMNPRGDLSEDTIKQFRVLRRGIPYGPELSQQEKSFKKTVDDRGLLFKCYQTNLGSGFFFLQTRKYSFPRRGS